MFALVTDREGSVPTCLEMETDILALSLRDRFYQYGHVNIRDTYQAAAVSPGEHFASIREARRALEGVVPCVPLVWRAHWARAAKEEHLECAAKEHPFTPLALLRRFLNLSKDAYLDHPNFNDPSTDRFGLSTIIWAERGLGPMLNQLNQDYMENGTTASTWVRLHLPETHWISSSVEGRARIQQACSVERACQLSQLFDMVLTGFMRSYRFLMAAILFPEHLHKKWRASMVADSTWQLSCALMEKWRFVIPAAWLVRSTRPGEPALQWPLSGFIDVRVWAKRGYTTSATLIWRLYHAHRLLNVAVHMKCPCLFHEAQLFIDCHLPLLSLMTRMGRWKDNECAADIEVPIEIWDRLNEIKPAIHPRAPVKLQERNFAFYYSMLESQKRTDSAESRGQALFDHDLVRGALSPTYPRIINLLRDFWPLSVDVNTMEEAPSQIGLLFQMTLLGENERRRGVQHTVDAMMHLFIGKMRPHRCMARDIEKTAKPRLDENPILARITGTYFELAALGNFVGVLNERPSLSSRVRIWLATRTESFSRTPASWARLFKHDPVKPSKRRELVVCDVEKAMRHDVEHIMDVARTALREVLVAYLDMVPSVCVAMRKQTPKLDMWRKMMRSLGCTWRRRLDWMPAYVPQDARFKSPIVWARAFILHLSETNALLCRGQSLAGTRSNIIARSGGFAAMMHSQIGKMYHKLEGQLSTASGKVSSSRRADNRRMHDVVDCYEKQAHHRALTGQFPKEYNAGMMRLVAWKTATGCPSLRQLKPYILAYFGVAEEVIEKLRVWATKYERYDTATNWFGEPIRQLWERYPQSFAVLWAYYGYLMAYRNELAMPLPRHVAMAQFRARWYTLQCSPGIKMGEVPLSYHHLSSFCTCLVCKRWAHPIAAEGRLDYVADRKSGRILDPVEAAARAIVKRAPTQFGAYTSAPSGRKRKRDVSDEVFFEEEELERLLADALASTVQPDQGERQIEYFEDDTTFEIDAAEPVQKKRHRPFATLGFVGPSPSEHIENGAGAPVGVHLLSRRSGGGGVTVNGSGVGVSNETSGLFQTDFVDIQVDPIRGMIALCEADTSKRAVLRESRQLFEDDRIVPSVAAAKALLRSEAPTYAPSLTSRRVVNIHCKNSSSHANEASFDASEYLELDSPESQYSDTTRTILKLIKAPKNSELIKNIEKLLMDENDDTEEQPLDELVELLNTSAQEDLKLLSSSVTRARRCGVKLTEAHMIGYMRQVNGVWYAMCGLCGSLVPARQSYLHSTYGITCPRHGLTNRGFDHHMGTFLPSPFTNQGGKVTLSQMVRPGWLRLVPRLYITSGAQLNAIPRMWLLRYGIDRPEQALLLYKARTRIGRCQLSLLSNADLRASSPALCNFSQTCMNNGKTVASLPVSQGMSTMYPLGTLLQRRHGGRIDRSYICDQCFVNNPNKCIYLETHLRVWFNQETFKWQCVYLCTRHWNTRFQTSL